MALHYAKNATNKHTNNEAIKISNSEAIGGIHSYTLWGKESTYNTGVAVTNHFSASESKFDGRINNNTTAHYNFSGTSESDGRKVAKYTHGVLELTGNMEFNASNFTFMEHVLGSVSGSGPYTYSIAAKPPSITLSTNIDNPGTTATDQEATYTGGVIDSCGIKTSVGQPMAVNMGLKFAKVVLDTSLSSRVAQLNEAIYNFSSGSVELPSGAAISNIIDSIDLQVANNYEMMAGVGSRLIQNALPKKVDITIKVTLKYLDNTLYTAALGATTPTADGGPTEYATMVLNFENADGDTIAITLSRVPLSEFGQIHQLNDPISEDLSFTAGDISAVETLA